MKSKNRFTHGRTSVYLLQYHLVWTTSYRNRVLKGNVADCLQQIFNDIAAKYGFEIIQMKIGQTDDVHLYISAPPKLSVTNIMRWLKGISARQLFIECPELNALSKQELKRHLWNTSYYVESIGTPNDQAMSAYIDKQKKP